jgi:predicted acyltransferase
MTKTSNRLTYLDWMRGLIVLVMLQGHVFDAWVRPQDRTREWFWISQFLGGMPAPVFLFLVGVSLALVLDRMRVKGASAPDRAVKVLRRAGWLLFLAYVFRVEQFLVWYPASQWSDLWKIDTLNCIGLCTLAIGLMSVVFETRRSNLIAMALATGSAVFLTPFIYPLRGLPSLVQSYLNGNGHSWYFSFFPWAAFAFAGMTFGYVLLESRERIGEPEFFKRVAVAGITLYAVGAGMSLSRVFEYGFFDYSLTSPHYFFVRLGWILLIVYGAYLWSRRRTAQRWSPLVSLGQASLIVYWLHIEIVYGRPLHNFGQSLEISSAALQLLWLVPLMLLAASWGRVTEFLASSELVLECRRACDRLLAREVFANVRGRLAVQRLPIAKQRDFRVGSGGDYGAWGITLPEYREKWVRRTD